MSESTGAIILSPRQVATGDPAGQALENLNTSVLGDGTLVYVESGPGQGEWQLEKTATAAPNGTTIVAPIAGPGRWYRKLAPGVPSGAPDNTYPVMADLRAVSPVNDSVVQTYGYADVDDSGGGWWVGVTGAAPGTYTHNGGTVIVPVGGDGSAAWVRLYVEEIDVRWFGVLPGSSTSASAFDSMVSTVEENAILKFTGNYLFDAPLSAITKALTIRGESPRGTEVEFVAGNPGFYFTPDVNDKLVRIEDLSLRRGTWAVVFEKASGYLSRGSHIQRVFISGQTVGGILIDGAAFYGSDFRDIHTANTGEYGLRAVGSGTMFNGTSFSNCRFAGTSTAAFYLNSGSPSAFDTAVDLHDCIIENNQSVGIYVKRAQVAIRGTHFEGNGQSDGEPDILIDTDGPGTEAFVTVDGAHFAMPSPAQANVRVRFDNTGIKFHSCGGSYWPHGAILDGQNHILASQIDVYGEDSPNIVNYTGRASHFSAGDFRLRDLNVAGVRSTVAGVRQLDPVQGWRAYSLGELAINDGGGATWYGVEGEAPGTFVNNNETIVVPVSGDGSAAWLRLVERLPTKSVTGTTYQFVSGDESYGRVTFNDANPIAVTVPDDSTFDFPVNTEILVYAGDVGKVTFSGESAATIESADGFLSLRTLGSSGTLWKRAANDWVLIGDLGS